MSSMFTRKKIEGYSYGLSDNIGKGYSSQVYRGRQDDSGQSVAVKVIDLRLLKNDINKVLLQSQIQVLKELKDLPHILSLNEVYTTKNNTYIITELCESDLSKNVKKGLAQPEAIAFIQQILIGYLQFARKDIIHRDLKPANILVTHDKQLKIADFGFAIKISDALKSNKYNVGSPLYMAPESLRRNQYSLKTDIWALGVIFYEILTGETPWRAKNQKELIRKIENQKLEDLLNKLSISSSSKDFLRRTLKTDKISRMDLDELQNFNFNETCNILTQKKLNIELRAININNNQSVLTPKTELGINNRRIDKVSENRGLAGRHNQNRKHSREHSTNKFNSFRNQSINQSIQLKPSLGHQAFTEISQRDIKENPEIPPSVRQSDLKQERKTVSKILVSEIHFCRFLFKLISKISDSHRKGLLQHSSSEVEGLVHCYSSIIHNKIDNLVRFSNNNFIQVGCYQQYKESADYTKLMKIARQYRQRYSQELKEYWGNGSSCTLSTTATLELVEHLHRLLKLREHQQGFLESCNYLITSKQLIELCQKGDSYERFARKSRIEEIVEGKTADISRQLYHKIMGRAREVASINRTFSQKEREDALLMI